MNRLDDYRSFSDGGEILHDEVSSGAQTCRANRPIRSARAALADAFEAARNYAR